MDENGNLTPDDFDLIDDLKLMGHGESDTSGCWIKLQVLPEHLERFRGLKGEIFEVTMRQLDNSHKPVRAPELSKNYGRNANILFRSGFFYNPRVVALIGTDEEFLNFVRQQRCIICGGWTSIYEDGPLAGEGYCDPAHVRRAARGFVDAANNKPAYSAVSMCNTHHRLQHQLGELAAYNEYCKISKKKETTNNAAIAKRWFEEKAGRMLAEWAHTKFAEDFGYSSLAAVPPKKIVEWCTKMGVLSCLPSGFTINENTGD